MKQQNYYASVIKRLLAHLIDIGLIYLIIFLLTLIFPLLEEQRNSIFIEANYLIISFIYYVYTTSSTIKGTVGKKMLGLAVVNENFNSLNIKEATNRYFYYFFSFFTCGLGLMVIFFNPKKQTLHDIFSSTYVVYLKNLKENNA